MITNPDSGTRIDEVVDGIFRISTPVTVVPGDCPVVDGGGYTGFEHNLYRVEIARTNSCRRPGECSRASCLSVSNDTAIGIPVRSREDAAK